MNLLWRSSLIFATIFVLLAMTEVFAQNQANSAKPAAKGAGKRTSIDFEDQLIEGSRTKPDLMFILQGQGRNPNPLIRLRENFLPEMRKTSEEIGRPGNRGNNGN